MNDPFNPIDNPELTSLTDEEILNILRRVQSGELSPEEAEQLLAAAASPAEAPESDNGPLDSQDFSAPLGKSANGKLIFERGAAGLTLRGEPLADHLFTAHFEHHVPIVRVNGGTVTIRYRDFGFGLLNWLRYGLKPTRGHVTLNADIPWQIDLNGGVANSQLDLRLVKLRGYTLNGGANNVKLMLGQPQGVTSVDFTSGVNNIKILRPADVAVGLTIHGGAAAIALDNQKFGAIGGTATLETPNSQVSPDRYLINVYGGANNFKVAAW